jgi:hypothetical protein
MIALSSETLIKHLGANQTTDCWNTWVTHLIRMIIKDSSTAWSQVCITDVLGVSLWIQPRVFFFLFRPCFCLNLGLSFLFLFLFIFLDFTLDSAKLIPNNIIERRFTSVEVLPHTTLLAVVKWEIGFATQQ